METLSSPEQIEVQGISRKLGQMAIERSNSVDARERLEQWSKDYRDTEVAFMKRKKDHYMMYEEFEKWEDDIAYTYERMKELEPAASDGSRYKRDDIEQIGSIDPRNTIEAEAGYYYKPRQNALIRAIESSDSDTKTMDLETVGLLYQFAGVHIYYERDFDTKRTDLATYNENRRKAHNDLINQLNSINDLARRYHVRPLTPRNFEDNSFVYNKEKDMYRNTDSRTDYDRTIVETYCQNAFSALYNDDYDYDK